MITYKCSFYADSLGKRPVNILELAKNPNPFSVTERKRTQGQIHPKLKKNLGKNEAFKKLVLIGINYIATKQPYLYSFNKTASR